MIKSNCCDTDQHWCIITPRKCSQMLPVYSTQKTWADFMSLSLSLSFSQWSGSPIHFGSQSSKNYGIIGVFPKFVNLPSNFDMPISFWGVCITSHCMFYIQWKVISEKFYHLKFIWFGVSLAHSDKNQGKTGSFVNFPLGGKNPYFQK